MSELKRWAKKMKLTTKQLVDWFFIANPELPPEAQVQWEAMLATPPPGATKSLLISGLKQGINDTLSMGISIERRSRIDAVLISKGLPTVGKMEAILKRKHQKIIARGRIRNAEEYYIVAEILSDIDFAISNADRSKLEEMNAVYESQAK